MRTIWACLFTGALCAAVAPTFAAPPQAPGPPGDQKPRPGQPAPRGTGRAAREKAQTLRDIFFPRLPPRSLETDKEVAGLAPNSSPELFTWKRVYDLALVRARGGSARGGNVLDANAIDRLADRHGVADFGRFRKDFLTAHSGADADGAFRDPGGDYLELLRQLLAVDHARRKVVILECCFSIYQELIKGEFAVVRSMDVDLVEANLCQARQGLAEEIARFRDQLDDFKAALGLPLDAPWIVDPRDVAAFRNTFEEAYNWHHDPQRKPEILSQLIARIPAPGELVIDGKPVLGAIEADPGRLEEVLAFAMRAAEKNRPGREKGEATRGADVSREWRIRRRVRRLVEARRAARAERRLFELASRSLDGVLAPITERPPGRESPLALAQAATSLLSQSSQIRNLQDLLVSHWASFQKERLALYRDLGALPYDDWKSFLDSLEAQPGPIEK